MPGPKKNMGLKFALACHYTEMMVNSKKHAAFIFANKICVSTCQLEGTDMEMNRHNYTPENKLEPKIWWFVDVFHFPGGRSKKN